MGVRRERSEENRAVIRDALEETRYRSKKDTKRWCGGHPGRVHLWGEWVQRSYRVSFPFAFFDRKCSQCSKTELRSERR